MVGWHHRFNGYELGQIPGDGEGQGDLVCCSPRSHEELEHNLATEQQLPMEILPTLQSPT